MSGPPLMYRFLKPIEQRVIHARQKKPILRNARFTAIRFAEATAFTDPKLIQRLAAA
jgi:hypothetical protein